MIPYSQALRYHRICSEDRQFKDRLRKLAGWLNERGYEESLFTDQIDRVREVDRGALLANVNKETISGRTDRIPLMLAYHPALNSVGKTIRDLHSVLSNSEEHRAVFPEPPVTAFRRCKNLKDTLVRARLTNKDHCYERGCSRCKQSRCQVCVSIDNGDSFHFHVTKEYKINFAFNCDSSNVVYLFDCVVWISVRG